MFNPEKLRNSLANFPSENTSNEEAKEYLNFYLEPFHPPTFLHEMGKFNSGIYEIFGQVFIPKTPPKSTVVLVHGYYNHTLSNAPLIVDLLKNNYAVAAYDLPGHGLSSGPRGVIDHFDDYAMILEEFIVLTQNRLPHPITLLGHSTGGVGMIDYLAEHPLAPVHKTILAAPLFRLKHWYTFKIAYFFCKLVTRQVPHRPEDACAAPGFIARLLNDPLENLHTPMKWLKAYLAWEKTNSKKELKSPIVLLQGTHDTTLDWKYGERWLKQHCTQLTEFLFPGACHHLFNMEPKIYQKVFEKILFALGDTATQPQTSLPLQPESIVVQPIPMEEILSEP